MLLKISVYVYVIIVAISKASKQTPDKSDISFVQWNSKKLHPAIKPTTNQVEKHKHFVLVTKKQQ